MAVAERDVAEERIEDDPRERIDEGGEPGQRDGEARSLAVELQRVAPRRLSCFV